MIKMYTIYDETLTIIILPLRLAQSQVDNSAVQDETDYRKGTYATREAYEHRY